VFVVDLRKTRPLILLVENGLHIFFVVFKLNKSYAGTK
jgi:hypothetical protein